MGKKRIQFITLSIVIFVLLISINRKEVSAEDIVPEGYIAIYTIDDLYAIRNNPEGNYILMADIDMSENTAPGGDNDCGTGWDPIDSFSGVFDGNNHKIIGMHIFGSPNVNYIGLFGSVSNATIRNLGMQDVTIDVQCEYKSLDFYVGGVVGKIDESSVYNCWTTGTISKSGYFHNTAVGGIVGWAQSLDLSNCWSSVDLITKNNDNNTYAGGLIGIGYSAVCKTSFFGGSVISDDSSVFICPIVKGSYMLNCFYRKEAFPEYTTDTNATGLTMAQTRKASYFTGFDFNDVWEIDPYCNYPYPQLKTNRYIKVTGMEIVTKPTKVEYYQGEAFSPAGATVRIVYDDGYDATIAVTSDMLDSYDMMKVGQQQINIKMGDKSVPFTINVKEIPVSSITFDKTSISVNKAQSTQLSVAIAPQNATDQTITWNSLDTTIATVNENGVVTGKKAGTTTITATTTNGIVASCIVTVSIPCAVILLEQSHIDMEKGNVAQLTAIISPIDSTDTIEWISSDSSVVSVAEGTLIAVGVGQATVTVKASSGVAESCTVIVKQKLDGFRLFGIIDKTYTGKGIVQDFKVSDGNVVLTKGVDYSVEYKNNINPGTATIWITGNGYYEGTITQTFTIKTKKYQVKFVDGTKVIKVQQVVEGEDATEPTITKKGYVFVGWDKDAVDVQKNLVVSAKWKKINLKKVSISSVKNTEKGKIFIKYKKVSMADGYEIKYALKSNMKGAKTIRVSGTSKKISKLKNKKYYIQVRAYAIDSKEKKVYGTWSNKRVILCR